MWERGGSWRKGCVWGVSWGVRVDRTHEGAAVSPLSRVVALRSVGVRKILWERGGI